MNSVLQAIETATSESPLVTNGLLVALHISQWSGRRLDREVSSKVAHDAGATKDAGNYNKLLVSKDALDSFQQITSEARTFHRDMTVPWLDNGVRYLPMGNYHDYLSGLSEKEARWRVAVDQFLRDYPSLIEASKLRLTSMWRETDYPSMAQMRGSFDFHHNTYPVPTDNDFRVVAEQEHMDELKANLRNALVDAQENAIKDLYNRVYTAVSAIAVRFKDPDEKPRFKSALVTNLRDLVMVLPKLNFTDDPVLNRVVQKAQASLAGLNPETLREIPSERQKARDAAQDILTTLRGVM